MFNQTCCGEKKQKPMGKQKFRFFFNIIFLYWHHRRGLYEEKSEVVRKCFSLFFASFSITHQISTLHHLTVHYSTPLHIVWSGKAEKIFFQVSLYTLISRCNENRSLLDSRRTWNLNTPSRQPWKEYILSINRRNEYIIRSYLCMRMDIEMTSFELWKSRLNSCWCHHLFHLLTQFHSFMGLHSMVVELTMRNWNWWERLRCGCDFSGIKEQKTKPWAICTISS